MSSMAPRQTYESFSCLPARFDVILDAAAKRSFFLSRAWFDNYEAWAVPEGEQPRIYAIESAGGEPLALLPMVAGASTRRPLAVRRLSGMANYYSSIFEPLMAPRHETSEVLSALIDALKQGQTWDVLDFRPMAAERPVYSGLLKAFADAGLPAQSYFCFGNWYLPVNGRSYEEYFRSRPALLRSTLRRKRRQLNAAHCARTEIITSARLEDGLKAYAAVYAASWKSPESFADFIPGLVRTCAEHACLRLGILYVDNEPAAAQVWIVHEKVASIYKLAYDPRYARFSVGSLLTDELVRHAIEIDRVNEIDFLAGDEAYKADWMSDRRERWGIRVFNPTTLRGLLGVIRHVGGRMASDAFRRMRWRTKLRRASIFIPRQCVQAGENLRA